MRRATRGHGVSAPRRGASGRFGRAQRAVRTPAVLTVVNTVVRGAPLSNFSSKNTVAPAEPAPASSSSAAALAAMLANALRRSSHNAHREHGHNRHRLTSRCTLIGWPGASLQGGMGP